MGGPGFGPGLVQGLQTLAQNFLYRDFLGHFDSCFLKYFVYVMKHFG